MFILHTRKRTTETIGKVHQFGNSLSVWVRSSLWPTPLRIGGSRTEKKRSKCVVRSKLWPRKFVGAGECTRLKSNVDDDQVKIIDLKTEQGFPTKSWVETRGPRSRQIRVLSLGVSMGFWPPDWDFDGTSDTGRTVTVQKTFRLIEVWTVGHTLVVRGRSGRVPNPRPDGGYQTEHDGYGFLKKVDLCNK